MSVAHWLCILNTCATRLLSGRGGIKFGDSHLCSPPPQPPPCVALNRHPLGVCGMAAVQPCPRIPRCSWLQLLQYYSVWGPLGGNSNKAPHSSASGNPNANVVTWVPALQTESMEEREKKATLALTESWPGIRAHRGHSHAYPRREKKPLVIISASI